MKTKALIIILLFILTGFVKLNAQTTIQGHVSNEANLAIPGVIVVPNGFSTGTRPDSIGFYQLQIPGTSDSLVFIFPGMKTLTAEINNQSVIDVVMTREEMIPEKKEQFFSTTMMPQAASKIKIAK